MTKKQIVLYWRKSWIDKDASDYILFDEYVRRIENEEILKNAIVADNPIQNASDFIIIRNYIDELCHRLVKFYGNEFNHTLGLDYTTEQWNIIWSHLYDEVFYWFWVYKKIDRFRGQNCYVVLCDEIDIERLRKNSWIEDPLYSAYIASIICKKIGIPYKKIKMEEIPEIDYQHCSFSDVGRMNGIERVLYHIKRVATSPSCLRDYFTCNNVEKNSETITIGLACMRFPPNYNGYICKNVSNVDFINGSYEVDVPWKIDSKLREELFDQTTFPAENEFEIFLPELLKSLIPVEQIENLKCYDEYATKLVDKWNYRVIIHSAGSTMPFLNCLAYAKKKGIEIQDVQHAGVYSINRNFGHKEEIIYDKFLTWGWKDPIEKKIRAVGINRITPQFVVPPLKKNGRILLVSYASEMNNIARGLYEGKYTAETKKFIRGLSYEKRKNLVIRTNTYTENSDLVEWVQREYPYVKFEKWNEVKMQDSVRKSDIVICDYTCSVFFESLVFGVHCAMFMAQKVIDFNDDFKPFYEQFKEHEIILESGDEMAQKVNTTKNIKQWLYNREVNDIYNEMQQKLMMPNKNVKDIWVNYLKNLA